MTCPPRAAVRQLSIADITFNWPRLTWPALALRQAGPWSRIPHRQREHDVEVRDGQQLGLALLHPCERLRALALGTMPVAAGVIGDRRVRAVLAAHNMAAESRRAAALDRRHHLELA